MKYLKPKIQKESNTYVHMNIPRGVKKKKIFVGTQLPSRLFSPSDISKKLSHHFLLHFPIGMGSYDHHAKYQGVFQELL